MKSPRISLFWMIYVLIAAAGSMPAPARAESGIDPMGFPELSSFEIKVKITRSR